MSALPDRRFLVLLVVWGLMGAVYVASVWVSLPGVPQVAFDAERWRSADPLDVARPVRSQMVDDLLDLHDFAGWRQQELVDLLGQPEPTCPGSDAFDAVFLIGPEGEPGSDFQWLAFREDDRERVVEFKVVVTGPFE